MTSAKYLNPSCFDLVQDAWQGRKEDLDLLWQAYCDPDNEEDYVENLGNIFEYGLAFDYVAPETFTDQLEGYWRYQISYGGPSEEIRFYSSSPNSQPYKIEFWYLDWFDGAKVHIESEEIALNLWHWFADCETTQSVYNQAME